MGHQRDEGDDWKKVIKLLTGTDHQGKIQDLRRAAGDRKQSAIDEKKKADSIKKIIKEKDLLAKVKVVEESLKKAHDTLHRGEVEKVIEGIKDIGMLKTLHDSAQSQDYKNLLKTQVSKVCDKFVQWRGQTSIEQGINVDFLKGVQSQELKIGQIKDLVPEGYEVTNVMGDLCVRKYIGHRDDVVKKLQYAFA